ncbi:hypothetical protein [Niallia sp. Krafla_26]|uniref:hypothetical protein n=1 Tax=Niallia sp. Krafla_26 TaxID=3064703 RepID=UPI003D16D376
METLVIESKMKWESSIIHEVAAEFEKQTGYEGTVIGDAVIDMICELEPESIVIYLTSPEKGDLIEELSNKGVFSFKEEKQYDNQVVSVGTWNVSDKEIQIWVGQESANEFVQNIADMDILLATYTASHGLSIPSREVEKALQTKTISYYSKRRVHLDENGQSIITYSQPSGEQMIRILTATGRYQFGLIPIYAKPSDHFKEHPFGDLSFKDIRKGKDGQETVTSELGNLLALEVPEYKRVILNIMNFLLLEVGYDFHELKKMGVTLHGYNHGFEVRLLHDDTPVLKSENGKVTAETIENVRNGH